MSSCFTAVSHILVVDSSALDAKAREELQKRICDTVLQGHISGCVPDTVQLQWKACASLSHRSLVFTCGVAWSNMIVADLTALFFKLHLGNKFRHNVMALIKPSIAPV